MSATYNTPFRLFIVLGVIKFHAHAHAHTRAKDGYKQQKSNLDLAYFEPSILIVVYNRWKMGVSFLTGIGWVGDGWRQIELPHY